MSHENTIAGRHGLFRSLSMFNMFDRLLADVSEMSGVHLCTPDEFSDAWPIIDGPQLDKRILSYLEHGGEMPPIPDWLTPLWDKFILCKDGHILRLLRQILLFCYKIELEPTNDQLNEAQASFENTDRSLEDWEAYFASTDLSMFRAARSIVGRTVFRCDWSKPVFSHGPGAVYPSSKKSEKSWFRSIYRSIEEYYDFATHLISLPSFWDEAIVRSQASIVEHDTIVSRLVAVPKDSRGPRLICVHPKEAIWIQQGCRRILERAIVHPRSPCYGRIIFDSQDLNGSIALASSSSREYCTLDLKEASDRLSCTLIRFLFGDYVYGIMSCSRASKVRLLDDRVIELRKWAPMGNCLTFPVQSLTFLALVRAGIRSLYGEDCTDVYVFGDDIIFPSKYYDGAIRGLVRAGVIPNLAKTFRHGFFRESCGVDAFKGVNVTPHRLKRLDCHTVSGATSVCSLAKSLGIDGYWRVADWLYRRVQEYWGPLPIGNNPDTSGIYRYVPCNLSNLLFDYRTPIKFNGDLHRWETPVHMVDAILESRASDAWWHLHDSLTKLTLRGESVLGLSDVEYTVPHRERSQRGWAPVL